MMNKNYDAEIAFSSREEIRDFQSNRLREQVRYVFNNSFFYRKRFEEAGIHPEDIRTVDDLQKIPFTTKKELRESQNKKPPFGEYLCISPDKIAWIATTSGTTGIPTSLPRSSEDINVWTDLMARAYIYHGVKPGDIVQNTFNYNYFHGSLVVHLEFRKRVQQLLMQALGIQRDKYLLFNFKTTFYGCCCYLST